MPQGQVTPRQTVEKALSAYRTNNFQAFKECIDSESVPDEFLRVMHQSIYKTGLVREQITRTLGKDAWDVFARPSPPGSRPVGQVEVYFNVPPLDDRASDELKFEVDGDTASYIDPATGNPQKLIRRGGAWMIVIPEGNYSVQQKIFKSLIASLDAASSHVNDKDMTAKKLKDIASAALVEAQKVQNK